MSEFFRPNSCDERGNALYPFIIKGTVSDDGDSVLVEAPAEAAYKWPTIPTADVAKCDETPARGLTYDEVRRFVAMGQRSVRDELLG